MCYSVVAYVQLSMEICTSGLKHNILHINISEHFENNKDHHQLCDTQNCAGPVTLQEGNDEVTPDGEAGYLGMANAGDVEIHWLSQFGGNCRQMKRMNPKI